MNSALPTDLSQIARTMQWYAAYSLNRFLPETVLVCGFLLCIVLDLMLRRGTLRILSTYFAIAVLIVAAVCAANEWVPFNAATPSKWTGGTGVFPYTQSLFSPKVVKGVVDAPYSMAVVDNFATFFKLLVSLAGVIVLVMSLLSKEIRGRLQHVGEYSSLIIGITIGLYLMPASIDLLMMYLSLELVSIASYILTGFVKDRSRNAEASMKYVLFGALSSALMIYGFSLIYGLTGSTNLVAIRQILASNPATHTGVNLTVLWAASILSLMGMAYKISAVPFHFWAPDVYEGAPTPITALLSVASKAAGFGLLMRFVLLTFPESAATGEPLINWPLLLAMVSVVTMTFGNLAALLQSNVKRMLAYSSIAHAGYMLAGVVVGGVAGIVSVMIYLATYLVMNLGAFFAVMLLSEEVRSESIEDYRGLMQRAPLACAALAIFLVSLTGLPATAGFIGKFYLFTAIVRQDPLTHSIPWLWLAIAAIVNTIISLYYYLRVVGAMFLKRSLKEIAVEKLAIGEHSADHASMTKAAQIVFEQPLRIPLLAKAVLVALVVPAIGLGLYFQPLVEFASGVIRFFDFQNIRY